MKALTMTQPWATLVAMGAKQYETRGWRPVYRGPLAIHASKSFPIPDQETAIRGFFWDTLQPEFMPRGGLLLPRGAILAVCELVECYFTGNPDDVVFEEPPWMRRLSEKERAFGNFSPGRWGWRLRNVQRLPAPISIRGYQFLWDVPDPVVASILNQLSKGARA